MKRIIRWVINLDSFDKAMLFVVGPLVVALIALLVIALVNTPNWMDESKATCKSLDGLWLQVGPTVYQCIQGAR